MSNPSKGDPVTGCAMLASLLFILSFAIPVMIRAYFPPEPEPIKQETMEAISTTAETIYKGAVVTKTVIDVSYEGIQKTKRMKEKVNGFFEKEEEKSPSDSTSDASGGQSTE